MLNSAGVPSVASFVQVSAAASRTSRPSPPFISPASNVTVNPASRSRSPGAGSDPDGVDQRPTPGPSPAASGSERPWRSRQRDLLNARDLCRIVHGDGQWRRSSVHRRRARLRFQTSRLPPHRGRERSRPARAAHTFTVAAVTRAAVYGTSTFSVSGLPANTTSSFNPLSLQRLASTTLTVSTSSTTPAGSYPLTIRGTSGSVVRTATVTLTVTVAGDFSLSGAPASQTVNNGAGATYTVSIRHAARVLRNREPFGRCAAQVRDGYVQPRVDRAIGHVGVDSLDQEADEAGNLLGHRHRHQRRHPRAFHDRRSGGAVTSMEISRRTLLQRIATGAAVGAGLPALRAHRSRRAPSSQSRETHQVRPVRLHLSENPYGPSPRVAGCTPPGFDRLNQTLPGVRRRNAPEQGRHDSRGQARQIVLGCGSSELLRMAASAFSGPGGKSCSRIPLST